MAPPALLGRSSEKFREDISHAEALIYLHFQNILVLSSHSRDFLNGLSSFITTGGMCDYTQVHYKCSHLRYTVRAWCTKYQETHKRCPANVVAM